MKTTGRILLTALLGTSSAFAAPFMAIGDNAELFLTGAVAVKFDDNIFLRPSGEINDTIYSFTPGVDVVFGKNAATSGNLYYNAEVRRYDNTGSQDTTLHKAGLNSLYSNGKTKLDFGGSYMEVAQSEISVPGAIIDSEVFSARALGEVGITEKSTLGLGVRYVDTAYQPTSFTDSAVLTLSGDVFTEYTEKLAFSIGYQFRSTGVSGGGDRTDRRDHFFNVGARGEFTPKLSGTVRVGYVTRDFDGGGSSKDSIGVDANLTYAPTAKTSLLITSSNDFGTTSAGQSTRTASGGLTVNSKIDEQWSWNANVAYRSIRYSAIRTDDYYEGSFGVRYVLNTYFSFGASYYHRTNDSVLRQQEFDNNTFTLSTDIRY